MEMHPEVLKVVDTFSGQGRTLESALGCYLMGELYGWRVLYMVNSQSHLRAMEKVLGLKFQDICPETTSRSKRCVGIRAASAMGSFWNVIKGSAKVSPVPERGVIIDGKS